MKTESKYIINPDLVAQETYLNLIFQRDQARIKADDSLARYKFEMFGYWASSWVKFNQLVPKHKRLANPFANYVKLARKFRDVEQGNFCNVCGLTIQSCKEIGVHKPNISNVKAAAIAAGLWAG